MEFNIDELLEGCLEGNLEKVKAAIGKGADPLMLSTKGNYPMAAAILSFNVDVVKYLDSLGLNKSEVYKKAIEINKTNGAENGMIPQFVGKTFGDWAHYYSLIHQIGARWPLIGNISKRCLAVYRTKESSSELQLAGWIYRLRFWDTQTVHMDADASINRNGCRVCWSENIRPDASLYMMSVVYGIVTSIQIPCMQLGLKEMREWVTARILNSPPQPSANGTLKILKLDGNPISSEILEKVARPEPQNYPSTETAEFKILSDSTKVPEKVQEEKTKEKEPELIDQGGILRVSLNIAYKDLDFSHQKN